MSFEAVLFDLDGTLLDTIGDLADSMNAVLERSGFPSHGEEAYKRFVGEGMENLVRRALPEEVLKEPVLVARYVDSMREEYRVRWKVRTRSYEGIPELLDSLAARRMQMAILSNKPDDFTKLMVADLLPRWAFAAVIGERPSIAKKPDPAGAIEIARDLRIPPARFLYIGDTSIDMRTAAGAGMFAVGVLWGFREAEELTANGARKLLTRPDELLDLL